MQKIEKRVIKQWVLRVSDALPHKQMCSGNKHWGCKKNISLKGQEQYLARKKMDANIQNQFRMEIRRRPQIIKAKIFGRSFQYYMRRGANTINFAKNFMMQIIGL